MAMKWVTTKYPGVRQGHRAGCDGRTGCACPPRFRSAFRRDGAVASTPTLTSPAAVLTWLEEREHNAAALAERAELGPTFAELAGEWFALVEGGRVEKRRGRKGEGYSATTVAGYRRDLDNVIVPTWGHRRASDIDLVEWQRWIDALCRQGLSRSRILNILAVVRGAYSYATRATRRIVAVNPTLGLDLPPKDEQPRLRIAAVPEARELLAALPAELRILYAIAFFAGLRRGEIARLEWSDVEWESDKLLVRKAKTEAGRDRRSVMAGDLKRMLRDEHIRQGRGRPTAPSRTGGVVATRSVFSGKLGEAAARSWRHRPGCDGRDGCDCVALTPITLHECRHTYASTLLAARYTIAEIMEFMGHDDLAATSRYLKKLPQPADDGDATRLNAYIDAFAEQRG